MARDYIDIGPIGAGALWAGTHAPGIPGMALTAAQLAMRGWNVGQNEGVRESIGLPGQSVGQWLGGILGLNNRGSLSGNNTVAAPGEFHLQNGQSPAVTLGGLYDNGGFFGRMLAGLFNTYDDMRTSMTPDEARFFRYAGGPAPANPAMSPTTYAPTGVMNPPKPAASPYAGATPVYQRDGVMQTLVGYQTPGGAMISPDAYNMAVSGLSPSVIGGVGGNGGGYMSSRAGQGSFSDGMGGTTSVGASGMLGHI